MQARCSPLPVVEHEGMVQQVSKVGAYCCLCKVAEGGSSKSSLLSLSFRSTSMATASDLNRTRSPARWHNSSWHHMAKQPSFLSVHCLQLAQLLSTSWQLVHTHRGLSWKRVDEREACLNVAAGCHTAASRCDHSQFG